MDIKLLPKANDSIEEYSKSYPWFSDLYNSMLKIIEQASERAFLSMGDNEVICCTKENWKQACNTSVYRLRVEYLLAKAGNRHVLVILRVKLS